MPTWPHDLFAFAFLPEMDERLRDLADIAEDEDWSYQHTPTEQS